MPHATIEECQTELEQARQRIAQLEVELTEQKNIFDAFFAATPAGMVIYDLDLRYVRMNENLAKINGMPIEYHIGKTIREALPDIAQDSSPIYQHVLNSGEPILNASVTGEMPDRPGIKNHYIASIFPLKGANNEAIGVGTAVVDVTELKHAEEALLKSQHEYEVLASAVPVAIFRTTPQGECTYTNQQWTRMTGLTFEQTSGTQWARAIHPDDVERVFAAWQKALEEDALYRIEYRLLHTNGSHIWILAESSSIKNEKGEITGHVGTATDLTERKTAEAERERLQQEIIDAQQQSLRELATPIIPVMDRILVAPLVGVIDTERARETTRRLLAAISQHRAKIVILDITGVPVLDSGIAGHLDKTIQAARLKGASTIISGISDAVAETIVDLGIDWSNLETVRDLQTGLLTALSRMGRTIST
jgi:PAS domain S-box-containing protein